MGLGVVCLGDVVCGWGTFCGMGFPMVEAGSREMARCSSLMGTKGSLSLTRR